MNLSLFPVFVQPHDLQRPSRALAWVRERQRSGEGPDMAGTTRSQLEACRFALRDLLGQCLGEGYFGFEGEFSLLDSLLVLSDWCYERADRPVDAVDASYVSYIGPAWCKQLTRAARTALLGDWPLMSCGGTGGYWAAEGKKRRFSSATIRHLLNAGCICVSNKPRGRSLARCGPLFLSLLGKDVREWALGKG